MGYYIKIEFNEELTRFIEEQSFCFISSIISIRPYLTCYNFITTVVVHQHEHLYSSR